MTRREFLPAAMAAVPPGAPGRLSVPVFRVIDTRAQCPPERLRYFWRTVWPEAVRDFGRGGIDLLVSGGQGEMRYSASDRPLFVGPRRGALNLVLTDHLPMRWDKGRALAGATTIFDGYHVSVVAMRYAHGNQIPFLAVNTCVHELLHALLQDIFVSRPEWYQAGERELRIDWYATLLWLFHDGAAVRKSAEAYLGRLQTEITAPDGREGRRSRN